MYHDKTICVVVPSHNEETQVGGVLEAMPDYVDKIVVVDDARCSMDDGHKTGGIIKVQRSEGVAVAELHLGCRSGKECSLWGRGTIENSSSRPANWS
jgi:hypothetical protein